MCLPERECVFRRDNVSSGQTMCLRERQCLFVRDNVSSGETMCLPERQCVFWRDNVSSGETMWLPARQCGFRRDNVASGETMWRAETGCPRHKLTSKSSLDLFPASIRIKYTAAEHSILAFWVFLPSVDRGALSALSVVR